MSTLAFTPLLLLLLSLPGAALAASCEDTLGRDTAGNTLDDRIRFLDVKPEFCEGAIQPVDCQESHAAMVNRLRGLKAKITEACRAAERADAEARARCNGAAACLAAVGDVVAQARDGLGPIDTELATAADEMKVIRDFTMIAVKNYLRGLERTPDAYSNLATTAIRPTALNSFLPMARQMVQAAENPASDISGLRRQLLELNGRGHDKVVVTMWAAVNALETEQFSNKQKQQIRNTITGLRQQGNNIKGAETKLAPPTQGRSAITGRTNDANTNGGPNPVAQALGSPALPAALNAASGLASAMNGQDTAAAPPSAASPAPVASSAPMPYAKAPGAILAARGPAAKTAESTDAPKPADPRASELGRHGSDFAFGSGTGSGGSLSGSQLPGSAEGTAGSRSPAAAIRVAGQGLVGDAGEGGTSPLAKAEPVVAPGAGGEAASYSLGGGVAGPGAEAALAEALPGLTAGGELSQGELTQLLESPHLNGSTAAGSFVSESGPDLFRRVWIAHNRSLKRGAIAGPRPKL